MAEEDPWIADYAYTRGEPDGGLKWVHQFGTYVREWIDPHLEEIPKGVCKDTLQYHVPKSFRGKYRVEQLPPEYLPQVTWDVDHDGYVLCTGITVQNKKCRRQAQNRSGYCEAHGGALHPMDRVRWVDPSSGIADRHKINVRQGRDLEQVGEYSRWQQLTMGIISVEDLDDEELARGQCRDKKGGFTGLPPRVVPRDLHDQMMKQLLSRAQQKFREGLLGSIEALTHIAQGEVYEPADRIKAATLIIDRVMGKTPDKLMVAEVKAPWEQIFDSISRDPDSGAYERLAAEATIDAEVVEEGLVAKETTSYTRRFGPPPNPGHVDTDIEIDPEPTLDGEPVTPPPMQAGPYRVPPQDPLARQNYERIRAAEETKEERESLKKRVQEGRARRYAARARGSESLDNLPYSVRTKELVAPTEETEGVYRVKFIAPVDTKVPQSVLAKEGRQRKYDRE